VDLDLEKFFGPGQPRQADAAVGRRIADKRMLKLIRAFLTAGVMENGLVGPVDEGTPQGGPLSPLLSNLVLDELDRGAGAAQTLLREVRGRLQHLRAAASGQGNG